MTNGKLMKWIKKKLGIVSPSDYWPMVSKKVNEDFWEGWDEGLRWIKENERARRCRDGVFISYWGNDHTRTEIADKQTSCYGCKV